MIKTIDRRITLIGAGPGDPDLITVKGLKRLAEADVVLYDALINTSLLKYAPVNSIKILVGKRAGYKMFSQNEINRMMVNMCQSHGHVVRLKGGDPNIFGRGFEEYTFAIDHGIPVELVPGISSSTGLPAQYQIPLTHRGISEGFWVITGTTKSGKISEDIRLGARSTATLIILMGMKKISEIVNIFIDEGRGETPVMIIQNGSLSSERKVSGKLNSIEEKIIKENIGPPAIIIIGDVINMALPYIRSNNFLWASRVNQNMSGTSSAIKCSFFEIPKIN
jgi:uroporphyrin-III C-methyltransferase